MDHFVSQHWRLLLETRVFPLGFVERKSPPPSPQHTGLPCFTINMTKGFSTF